MNTHAYIACAQMFRVSISKCGQLATLWAYKARTRIDTCAYAHKSYLSSAVQKKQRGKVDAMETLEKAARGTCHTHTDMHLFACKYLSRWGLAL